MYAGLDFDDDYFKEMFDKDTYNPDAGLKFLEELNIFKEGEEYKLVKDLQDGFKDQLSKSMKDRLFDELPDYMFWDIKKPIE